MTLLLPTAYLGPIQYYTLLANPDFNRNILFECWEYYEKQTFRNRCCVYGANGMLNLVIPIKHQGKQMVIKEVKIANDGDWQRLHWRSLQTAYRSSPYFEYYEDDFAPFYTNKYQYLIDFNEAIQSIVLKLIGLEIKVSYTTSYQADYPDAFDCRNQFSPKHKKSDISTTSGKHETDYTQVFESSHGFIPNLSIVDLLFNIGPEALSYLKT